jgi:hypothetical protein
MVAITVLGEEDTFSQRVLSRGDGDRVARPTLAPKGSKAPDGFIGGVLEAEEELKRADQYRGDEAPSEKDRRCQKLPTDRRRNPSSRGQALRSRARHSRPRGRTLRACSPQVESFAGDGGCGLHGFVQEQAQEDCHGGTRRR